MAEQPDKTNAAPRAYYDELDIDVGMFPVMWSAMTVGHLLATDLDRVCRPHGLSIADANVMGAIRFVQESKPPRAADLALTLRVSNAVLSTRVAKLEGKGLLLRIPDPTDKRAFSLKLTKTGEEMILAVLSGIGKRARFVRSYKRLSEQDQQSLMRILTELQNRME
jgi:DNA-binding MarR family transcriptional regulator